MRAASHVFLPLRIRGNDPLTTPLLQRAPLRAWTARSSCAALAFAACPISQSAWAGGCDTANIDGYPPEPVAQCAEAKMTVETGGMARCDGDLERMAATGADAYAAKGNPAAAEYAGPMGGFFKVAGADPSPAGVCAVSCLKLPLGTKVVDARAATTTAASKSTPKRRVYANPSEEVVPGEATYISRIIVAKSTIGPLVCMAVANWQNRAEDQDFSFYAYYVTPPEWPAGQQ